MKTKKVTAKKLAHTALFASLCCIATYIIAIPLPYGYLNIGDVFVLMSGWCLGALYGGIAAAVGSALADVLSGYALYAPVTFLIKGGVAAFAYMLYVVFKKCIQKESFDFLFRAAAAFIAELWMVVGYFLFESILYGVAGGLLSVIGNVIQGGACLLCGTLFVTLLRNIASVKRTFPCLCVEKIEDAPKTDKRQSN